MVTLIINTKSLSLENEDESINLIKIYQIIMTPSLSAFINSLLAGLFIVIIPIGTALFLVSQSDRLKRN
jgi:hypothetical protein